MPAAKQVVYVDVDDEITSIIDKVNGADAKVVAVVLPKRAAVFQSIVNMKLLQRRAEQAGKHLVLITSEASLMPLAGLAGVYVAPTLQSRPEIPAAPADDGLPDDIDEDAPVALGDGNDGSDRSNSGGDFRSRNAQTPVGSLVAQNGPSVADLPDDMVELDRAAPAGKTAGKLAPQMAALAAADGNNGKDGKAKPGKGGKDKKLTVPNFFAFRKRLLLAGLVLVVLAGLWYVAWFVLPTATVTIKTQTSNIDARLAMTLDTDAQSLDISSMTIPAQTQQQQKTNTQQVPATGTENKGNKATGTVTLTNCSKDNQPVTIPAGTGISANGMTYLTQSTISLATSAPDSSGNCRSFSGLTSADVNVTAQKPGTSYNLGPSTFGVAGFSSVNAKSAAAMSGGTDDNVKVVQQSDIDAATQKLATQEPSPIKQQLKDSLEHAGLYAIEKSYMTATTSVTTSAKAGDEADTVTMSKSVTYTMYGVKKADLRTLVENAVNGKIDKSRQSIIDDGIDTATFSVEPPDASRPAPAKLKITMAATAVAGPQLNVDQVKQQIVGKKSGEVRDQLKANPGVDNVVVNYSPFWVTKAPKPAKTTIIFEKSGQAGSGSSSSSGQTDSTGSGQ